MAAEMVAFRREGTSLGGGTSLRQIIPGSSTGDRACILPAAPGRGVQGRGSHLHRDRHSDAICPAAAEEVSWVGLAESRAWGDLPAAVSPEGLGGTGKL